MRRLIHISDLHFGRPERGAEPALLAAIAALEPHLVVISGDFTQRAFRSQFRAAAGFLRRLTVAPICVPGNHDIPLLNPLARLGWPLTGYRRWISRRLDTFYEDEMVAIAALNTARGWTFMEGRLAERQCRWLEQQLAATHAPLRLIVSHHPLDLPVADRHAVPALATRALQYWIEGLEVDLFLAGHLHRSRTMLGPQRTRSSRTAIFSQAGTAISDRHSGAGNAFTAIELDTGEMQIDNWSRTGGSASFTRQVRAQFVRNESGWSQI